MVPDLTAPLMSRTRPLIRSRLMDALEVVFTYIGMMTALCGLFWWLGTLVKEWEWRRFKRRFGIKEPPTRR